MNKLLIVGTVAFDAIETPFGKTDKILGGAGTYIGLSASFFNLQSAIVSVVGDDFPQEYIDLLTARNIDVSGLEIVKGGKTFFWSGKYHNDLNSRDTLVTELNTLADFQPKVPENFKDADVVMLGNLHPLVQSSVLDQMSHKPKLVVLDTMNFWMDCALPELLDVMKRIDVITINDEEARQLSGEYSLVKAAAKIHTMGPKYIVIKKENTAHCFSTTSKYFCPGFATRRGFRPNRSRRYFCGRFCWLYRSKRKRIV
jgi:sugar/nucleoside kinase (ribokinase family)